MLTISNTCSDIVLAYTPTDSIPYFIINKTLFIIDISKSIADDIIAKFNAKKEFVNIKHISLQQYDIYRDIEQYKAGLAELFSYLIFDNQDFVSSGINVVAPNETFYNAAKEQIIVSQRTITSTGELFPQTDTATLDTNSLSEEMKGSMLITQESPLISIRLDITLSKSYEEIIDSYDATKDTVKNGITQTYVLHTHIWHDIISFGMGRSIAKFYGPMTTTKNISTGGMSIDIHNMIKEVVEYVPKATTGSGSSD